MSAHAYPDKPYWGYTPVSRSWQTGIIMHWPLVVLAHKGAFLPERMIVSFK